MALAAALLSACEGTGSRRSASSSSAPAEATTTTVRIPTLDTVLAGAAVVPGPGSPSASGQARLTVDPDAGQVCWEVTVAGVDVAASAHLHTAPLGAVGPVTVALTLPTGCAAVAPELAASVVANPSGFYVDVHDGAFPGGAVRGQLGR